MYSQLNMTGNRLIKVEIATEGMRPSIMPWIVELRLIIGLRKGSNFSKLLNVAILVMKVTRFERQREKKGLSIFFSRHSDTAFPSLQFITTPLMQIWETFDHAYLPMIHQNIFKATESAFPAKDLTIRCLTSISRLFHTTSLLATLPTRSCSLNGVWAVNVCTAI